MRPALRASAAIAAAAVTLGAATTVQQMIIDVGEEETLATFDGSYEAGINAAGTIAGHAGLPESSGSLQWRAYRSVGGRAAMRLRLPPGWRDGIATAVSETDRVVGYAYEPHAGEAEPYKLRAVTWDAAGRFTALPPGDGPPVALGGAFGVSPSGRYVVGIAYHADVGYRSTRWDRSTPTQLDLVCASDNSCDYGDARVVNDAGVVGGVARNNVDGTYRAVRWAADGSSQMLPHPDGVPVDADVMNVQVRHIAANGDIYGHVYVHYASGRGSRTYLVRWTVDGSAHDITPPSPAHLRPSLYDANDDGLLERVLTTDDVLMPALATRLAP